jgi:hypothetical protein
MIYGFFWPNRKKRTALKVPLFETLPAYLLGGWKSSEKVTLPLFSRSSKMRESSSSSALLFFANPTASPISSAVFSDWGSF